MHAILYANERIRNVVPAALVRHLGLDVEIRDPQSDPKWATTFPLRKVPCLLRDDGFALTEVIAIMFYLVELADDPAVRNALIGHDPTTRASILMHLSQCNSYAIDHMVIILKQVRGLAPASQADWDAALAALQPLIDLYERRLSTHTYLASDSLSLADLFVASIFSRCFEVFWGSAWRDDHPAITRWFRDVTSSPILREHYATYVPIDEPLAPPV